MFKSIRVAGFLFLFSVMGTFAAFAQTPQLPQQQQQQVEVSDSELQKFANAFQGIRMINQEAQEQMLAVVEEEGMEVQRFTEIHQAAIDPAVEVKASEEELAQHKKISGELEKLQAGFESQMENVIEEQDLTIERYTQIAQGLQSSPELQERLRVIFQG